MTATTYYDCPACGRSFKVRSMVSARIFCSRACATLLRSHEPPRNTRTDPDPGLTPAATRAAKPDVPKP